MSGQPSEPSKTEVEVVIDRRMIGVGAAIAVLLVVVPLVGFLCFRGQKSESEAQPVLTQSTRTGSPSRADAPRVRFDPAAVASLEPPPPVSREPAPVRMPKAVTNSRPRQTAPIARQAEPAAPPSTSTEEKSSPQHSARYFKRLDYYVYDFELLHALRDVPEFDLNKELRSTLLAAGTENKANKADKEPTEPKHVLLDLASNRADLQALPLRQAKDCQKQKESARVMRALSSYIRNIDPKSALSQSVTFSQSDQLKEDMEYVNHLQKSNLSQLVKDFARNRVKDLGAGFKWDGKIGGEELGVLMQMLQVKGKPVRMELVKMLDACREAPAGILLAQRAMFDFDADVREAAVAAMSKRPRSQYRDFLLAGLRHPWPPVAAHAAEALAELRDLDAAPRLADVLNRPDPCAPRLNAKGHWVVDEMVSINHLRNCVLCHASSRSESDPGRSPVPEPGRPLPVVYYESIRGYAVRTDITYLRQDFSAMQFVEKPDKWPSLQRFDYVVRTRELSAEEANRYSTDRAGCESPDYPQRKAVLFALREITGEDAGTSSADWKRLLSRIGLEAIPASEPVGGSAPTISKKSLK